MTALPTRKLEEWRYSDIAAAGRVWPVVPEAIVVAAGEAATRMVVQDASAIPESIKSLAEARWQARLDKNWAESDRLRAQLAEQGWVVKDGKDGYVLEAATA